MQGIWLVLFIVQSAVVLAVAMIVVGILRYLGRIQERIDLAAPQISAFALGEALPEFQLSTSDGSEFSLSRLREHGRPSILLFLTPSCGGCKAVLQQLQELSRRSPAWDGSKTEIAVIVGGGSLEPEIVNALSERGATVLFDAEGVVFSRFGIRSIPTGLVIEQGLVKGQSMNPQVGNWLYQRMEVAAPPQPPSPGWGSLIVPRADLVRPESK
jgi:thiol-disulfide isomerase/thioredoxin